MHKSNHFLIKNSTIRSKSVTLEIGKDHFFN